MKYLIIIFCFFLLIFTIFAGLVIYKSSDGSLDTCIYKFEDCILAENGNNKFLRTISCSNKIFVCNSKSLYYSFFDEEKLDEEYNDYMYERIKRETEAEEKAKEEYQEDIIINIESLKEDKTGYNIDVDL